MADALNISTFKPEMGMIPVGARLDRAYFTVPTLYTSGEEFATEIEAMKYAIDEAKKLSGSTHTNPTVTVDLRWSMSWEPSPQSPSSGSDFVVERTTYKNIIDAAIALTRRLRVAEMSA